jgi:hypothetical protein
MSDASMTEPAGATRRGMALAAVGAAFTAAVAFAPAALAAETPLLQVSYSTDPYMTCDALQEEVARMDMIVAAQGATATLVKTARERKQKLGEILKSKSCVPKPAKVFGPDMYDLPGTAPGRR